MSEYDSYTNDELYEYLLKIDKDAAFKTHPQNRRRFYVQLRFINLVV